MKKQIYVLTLFLQLALIFCMFTVRLFSAKSIHSYTNMLLNVAVTFFLLFAIILVGIWHETKKDKQFNRLSVFMLIVSILLLVGSTLYIGLADRSVSTGFYEISLFLFLLTILQCIKTSVYIRLWLN